MAFDKFNMTPDYSKYPAGLSGFTGIDRQEIWYCIRKPAVRSRIGWRGLYKTGLTRLHGGALLTCPCYLDYDNKKYYCEIFRSDDEGITWKPVETKGDRLMGKEPVILALKDGGVLHITTHPHGFRISRSDDDGVTWKTGGIGEITDKIVWTREYETPTSVLEEEDGTLTLLLSHGSYDLTAPLSQNWLFKSKDGGRSWEKYKEAKVKGWEKPMPVFDEGQTIRLSNGRLLATGRLNGNHQIGDTPPPHGIPMPDGDESGDHMMICESFDNGLTWTEPETFLGYSKMHAHLLELSDGRLLCSYVTYHLPIGIFAILSEDGGKTWDHEHPIMLAESMSMSVGWPVSVQLPGGDIVTAYSITAYLEGEGVAILGPGKGDTVAESVRWQVPPRK